VTKRVLCAAIVTASVLLMAGQSVATGPDDGIWFVVQSNPQRGVFQLYTSVHQNGTTVVLISLYGNGAWDFGIGTRSGDTAQGTGYTVSGLPIGTFSVTLTSSTTFSGQAIVGGVVWSLVGSKLS
jgi:hypothetical protein